MLKSFLIMGVFFIRLVFFVVWELIFLGIKFVLFISLGSEFFIFLMLKKFKIVGL